MKICHADFDLPEGQEELLQSAQALGEPGRREFLRLVRGRRPEAECALSYLTDFEDKRAVPLIREILRDPKAGMLLRRKAIVDAGRFQDAGSFDGVLAAFQSGNVDFVEPAAIALGALRDERGLRVLREALTGDWRFEVVTAVGFEGHEAAVEPLLLLMDDPVVARALYARCPLALSLARIGTPKSRDGAIRLLEGMEDNWDRRRLVGELFEIFVLQRSVTQDADRVAAINRDMDRLRADPAASHRVRTYP